MEKIYAVLNKFIDIDGEIYFNIVKTFKVKEKAEECLQKEINYSIEYWKEEGEECTKLTKEETWDKLEIDGLALQIGPEISESYDIYSVCEVGLYE